MSRIYLRGKKGEGKFAEVDDDDFERLNKYKWYYGPGGYAYAYKVGYMHRNIIEIPEGLQIDHINRDKLDNRRSNLRVCTSSENNLNRSFKRYSWDKSAKRWKVYLRRDGKIVRKSYMTEEEARSVARKRSL